MRNFRKANKGASFLSNIFYLALLGYAIYVVVQYIPLMLESSTVDSILNTIQDTQLPNPVVDVHGAENKVSDLLNLNEMNDLKNNFKVTETADSVYIDVFYQRELDLLFMDKTIDFDKSLVLLKPSRY